MNNNDENCKNEGRKGRHCSACMLLVFMSFDVGVLFNGGKNHLIFWSKSSNFKMQQGPINRGLEFPGIGELGLIMLPSGPLPFFFFQGQGRPSMSFDAEKGPAVASLPGSIQFIFNIHSACFSWWQGGMLYLGYKFLVL